MSPSKSSIYYYAGSNWLDLGNKPTLNSLLGFSHQLTSAFYVFAEFYLYKATGVPLN